VGNGAGRPPEREGRSAWGWVSLVWKEPGRPAYLLAAAALEIKDDPEFGFRFHPHGYGMAERNAERLGVPLVVIGVESAAASVHPIPGQEGGYQT
jgi:hypothetical protein